MPKIRKLLTGLSLVPVLFVVSGCSPAVQPPAPDHPLGTPTLAPSGWQVIMGAVQHNQQAGMFRMKMTTSVAAGAIRSTFSMYGSFNPPDRAAFTMQVNDVAEQFYQQGTSAYAQTLGGWSQTTALPSIDVMASYQLLVSHAGTDNVPVYRLKDTYVLDEYCQVYEAVVPAAWLPPLLGWEQFKPATDAKVQYYFYVGKNDGALREVTTNSVGSVTAAGPVSVSSDTMLFNIGQPAAKVQFPVGLLKSFEN